MNKFMNIFRIKSIFECRSVSTRTRITADGKEVPKTKNFENRITLISPDNSVSITDLKNAQNLSIRRELKLVKIQDVDAKTRRPIYKLMTNSEYHAEELEKRKEKQTSRNNSVKGEKLLTLSSRIGEHDLMTGVRKMMKLLEKQYVIKVLLASEGSDGAQNLEKIYSVIEKNIKPLGRVEQKRSKGNNMRFQLLPSKSASSNTDTANGQQSDGNEKGKEPL